MTREHSNRPATARRLVLAILATLSSGEVLAAGKVTAAQLSATGGSSNVITLGNAAPADSATINLGDSANDVINVNGTTTFNGEVNAGSIAAGGISAGYTYSDVLEAGEVNTGLFYADDVTAASLRANTSAVIDENGTELIQMNGYDGTVILTDKAGAETLRLDGLGGHVTAAGTVTASSLTDGTATLTSGNLTTTGNVTAGAVTGTTVSGGSLTDGTATLSGGNLSGIGNLTATGAISGASLNAGTGAISGGTLTVAGEATFDDQVTVEGDLTVNGALQINDLTATNLHVTGASMLDGNLTAQGATNIIGTGASLNTITGRTNTITAGANSVAVDAVSGVAANGNGAALNINGANVSLLNAGSNPHGLTIGDGATTLTGGASSAGGEPLGSSRLTLQETAASLAVGGGTAAPEEVLLIDARNDAGATSVTIGQAGNTTNRVQGVATTITATQAGSPGSGELQVDAGGVSLTYNNGNAEHGIKVTADGTEVSGGLTSTAITLDDSGATISGSNPGNAGNLTVNGTSNLQGDTTVAGSLNVSGPASLASSLTVQGMTATSGISNTGNLTNSGQLTTASLATSGNADVGGNLAVNGTTTLKGIANTSGISNTGDLANSGKITTASLATTGNADVGGNLAVNGTTTLNGATRVNNQLDVQTGNSSLSVANDRVQAVGGGTGLTLNGSGATFGNRSGGPVRVTGVANGVNPYDAVNKQQLDQLDQQITSGSNRAYSGVATVAAMANIPEPMAGRNYSLGVGYGTFASQNAYAFGFKANVYEGVRFSVSIGQSNVDLTAGVGVGYSW